MDRPITSRTPLVVIVGPTASGKSELAVRLAKKFGGEIISADSRQIYKGLDVGTAKILGQWREENFFYKGIPHHCIDFVRPQKTFSAAEYKQCAGEAIRDIGAAGKLPILVGGTGFWIDAAVHDLVLPKAPPNQKLRNRLGRRSPAELFVLLKRLDPRRAAAIEQKNPRRLIRAIEIARALGEVPPLAKNSQYDALWIGMRLSPATLKRRIMRRAEHMIRDDLLAETRRLLKSRVSKKRIREFGFEYRIALDALEKKISRATFRDALAKETMRYSKRQMTWFKKNKSIRWITTPRDADLLIRKLSFLKEA